MKKDFYVYQRQGKHRAIDCVQFSGADARRSSAISTGQTSKAAATNRAIDFPHKGGSVPTHGRLTFRQFAADWWIYVRCPYIYGKTARGFSISKGCAVWSSWLECYVLPAFGQTKLSDLRARMIEIWVMGMREAGCY